MQNGHVSLKPLKGTQLTVRAEPVYALLNTSVQYSQLGKPGNTISRITNTHGGEGWGEGHHLATVFAWVSGVFVLIY